MFPTIGNKVGLAGRVVTKIQKLMINGHLEPGMELPTERDLAEQIRVSRTVIREAVRMFETRGLLTHGARLRNLPKDDAGVPGGRHPLADSRKLSLAKHDARPQRNP